MKKTYLFIGLAVTIFISAACILSPSKPAADKSVASATLVAIPDDVNAVFKASCMPCHAEGGKNMAMSMVNFSKWEEYTTDKQAKKASKICDAVTKGSMPPKGFRESNPDAVLTKDKKEMICKWSATLAPLPESK